MSDGFFNCWVNPNRSAEEVGDQMTRLREYTEIAFDKAIQIGEQLTHYNVPSGSVPLQSISFDGFPISDPTSYIPDLDESNQPIPNAPNAPNITLPGALGNPGPAPDRPAEAPPPTFGVAPSIYTPVFGAAPTINYPTLGEYGDYTGDIPEPNLHAIVLPDAPAIDIDTISFDAIRPVFDAVEPDAADFNYVEEIYGQILSDEIKAKLQSMLNGQSGIPVEIERALWEREAEREAAQEFRAEQEVVEDWGARGFSRPGGIVSAELRRIRQNSWNQRNQKSRDVAIRTQDVLLEQLKFACTSGIALEDMWMRMFNSVQDRRLQAAQVAVNISIAVFNAKVSLFNAEMQGYQIDAQVYKERIEAEIAKVQVYAEQVRAQSLIGQLNQQEIEMYTARLSAVETNVRVYLGFIQAYTARLDGERIKLDVYRTQLEAENTKLQGSSLQVQAFGQLIQAESIKQQTYVSRAQIYQTNVSAWQTEYQALIEKFKVGLGYADTQVRVFDSTVRGLEAQLGVVRTRIDEVTSRNQAKVQAFSAIAQAAGITNDATARRALARTDTNRSIAELAIKVGDINITNTQRAAQINLEAIQAAARVLAQMASGAMAAGSVSANIQDSTSAGAQCSYNTQQTI